MKETQIPFPRGRWARLRPARLGLAAATVVALLLTGACGSAQPGRSSTGGGAGAGQSALLPTTTAVTATATAAATAAATATATAPPPTSTPTATAIPLPTASATPEPRTQARADVPVTPQVTIPAGWPVYNDSRLGYSLALPRTWLKFDLRSEGFQSLFSSLGAGVGQYQGQLQEFLDSPAGEYVGVVAVEPDITQMFARHPFPAIANVSVVPLREETTELEVQEALQSLMRFVPVTEDYQIGVASVNNLPGIRAAFDVDLADFDYPVVIHVEQAGLIANGRLYVLTLAVRQEVAERRAAIMEQILGTFRPE